LDVSKTTLPTIPNELVKNYSLVKDGDLVMADASEDYSGVGKSVEIKKIGFKKIIAGLHTFLFRDANKVFVDGFRGYIHSNSIVKRQFDELATGMKVYGVSKSNLKKILIPIPTLAEQTAIATALSDADGLITSLEKLIAKKRNIKQGAMQELLRPKEGWVVKKLGEIGEVIIGLTYKPENVSNDGVLVLRSSNIQYDQLEFIDNVYVNINVSEKLRLKENDILICVRNGSRDLIGKCALITSKVKGESFGAFMSVFRSPLNRYVIHVFRSDIVKKQIEEYLGATINQITNKSLNSFEIPFPPPNEQLAIATILSDMDTELLILEKKLEKAKQIKQGMMQQLLTGKIRLI